MNKKQFFRVFVFSSLLGISVFGAACGSRTATIQTTRVKSTESPTPGYKPPKRVSRDVIKTETKEVVKTKAEK